MEVLLHLPVPNIIWWDVTDVPVSVFCAQTENLTEWTRKHIDPKTCELDPSVSVFNRTTDHPAVKDNGNRKVLHICPINFLDLVEAQ